MASSARFFSAGVSGFADTRPQPTGWAAYATPISSTTGLYSFSDVQFSRSATGTLVTTTGSGLALYVRSLGNIDLYGLATGGVTTSGTVTSGSLLAGFIAIDCFKKGHWCAVAGYNVLRSAVLNTQTIQLGVGYRP